MPKWLHIHRYGLVEDWAHHNWGGVLCYRKTRVCRCGAQKVKIRAYL